MNASVITAPHRLLAASASTSRAVSALRFSAAAWASVAVLGQFVFAVYVALFYGRSAARGDFAAWNKVLQVGYVPGDTVGNLVLASHLLLGAVVTLAGGMQLVPMIRRRWPRWHRWNGRVFVLAAMIAAVGGLIMIWTRSTGGDLSQHIAISLNALFILSFGGLAWRHARARRFDAHREWALRLFLCANGGWFFRIGLMLWLVIMRAPVGFDPKTFTGPFITFLSFAQYALPLAFLQLYLLAQQRSRTAPLQWVAAAVLLICALGTLAGSAAAAAMLWLPHI